jgi:membrane protein required for colicin V production
MSNLNWVDYIILAIFFFSMLAGFGRGFVREMISLVTLIAAFVIASMFANAFAQSLMNSSLVQGLMSQASSATGINASQPVSFIAIGLSFALIFGGVVLVGSLVGYFVGVAFQAGMLGIGNRLLGAAFGFVRGFIVNLVIIFVVQLSPLGGEPWWQQSHFVQSFQPAVQWLGNLVSPSLSQLKEKFGQTWQDVNSSIQNITNSAAGLMQ